MIADLALAGLCFYAGVFVGAKYGGARQLWERARAAFQRAKETN